MIFIYFLLVIALIITFIMIANISAFIRIINNDIYLKVGAYGIYFWVLNPDIDKSTSKKKNSKKKSSTTKNNDTQKQKKKQEITKSKNSFLDMLKNKDGKFEVKKAISLFFDIAKVVFPMIKNILFKLKIKNLKVLMSVSADDAHSTAIQYANISNSIEILALYLQSLKFVKIKKIQIYPDFVTGEIRSDISFFIKIRVYTILFESLKALTKFVINYIKKQNNHKKEV